MEGLGQTKGLAAAAESGSWREDGSRSCCLQTVAGLLSGCVSRGVWWLSALMGLPLNPSFTSSAHPFYLFLYHLSKQTLNLFLQNQLVLEHAVQVKVEMKVEICLQQNRPLWRSGSPSPRWSLTIGPSNDGRMPSRRAGETAWTWRPASSASGPRRGSSSTGTSRWSAPRRSRGAGSARHQLTLWHQHLVWTNRRCPRFWITPAGRGGWDSRGLLIIAQIFFHPSRLS